jgi:hypothetical protein
MIFVKEKSGKYGFYKFLTHVVKDYPELNLNTLKTNFSRKETKRKGPYLTGNLEIYKGEIKTFKK